MKNLTNFRQYITGIAVIKQLRINHVFAPAVLGKLFPVTLDSITHFTMPKKKSITLL
jgi:hypothetical protein